MSLTPEQRAKLREPLRATGEHWLDPEDGDDIVDALAPVVQEMLAEAWQQGWYDFQSQVSWLEEDPGNPDEMNPYKVTQVRR